MRKFEHSRFPLFINIFLWANFRIGRFSGFDSLPAVRFEPGTAAWEARSQPLCNDFPNQLKMLQIGSKVTSTQTVYSITRFWKINMKKTW